MLVAALGCTSPDPGAERGWGTTGRPSLDDDETEGLRCGDAICHTHATCARIDDTQQCQCRDGFEGDGLECEDIDECANEALHDCDANARCINLPGTFRCECEEGYLGDGRECTGVEQCTEENNLCDPNALCIAAEGGFDCECNSGFEGDGFACGDIDECAEESYVCAIDARCVNTYGSYRCECETGFVGDGDSECQSLCDVALADPTVCAEQGLCRVQDRSASCDACAPGFSGDGIDCVANTCASECDGQGTDAEHAICLADGSCACAPGFSGTPGECIDIDECAEDSGLCGEHAQCINVEGGYLCECEAGYEFDESGTCVDIDECALDPGPCHPDATCTNFTPEENPQGYECECNEGFTGDGKICHDIDECAEAAAEDESLCPERSTCVNRRGDYDCQCRSPLVGEADNCHCDLTGYWAMRQDVDICWKGLPVMEGTSDNLISEGYAEATVWELHEIRYDGEQVQVRKQGCGADNYPDLVSPLFRETYSSYVPLEVMDGLDMYDGRDFEAPGLVPSSSFQTPIEGATLGIDLGDRPEEEQWPSSRSQIPESQWEDPDGDGEPGITLWPRLPSELTESGNRNYSYLPVRANVSGSTVVVEERAGCVSLAMRVITHLEAEVETCDRIVGEVIGDEADARVHGCTLVPKGECDEDSTSSQRCSGWTEDVSCGADTWANAERCTSDDLDLLDDEQNQAQSSRATFELVKMADLDDEVGCGDVRSTLPAFERPVPTITCTPPE